MIKFLSKTNQPSLPHCTTLKLGGSLFLLFKHKNHALKLTQYRSTCYMPHSRDPSTWYSVTLLYGWFCHTDFERKPTKGSKDLNCRERVLVCDKGTVVISSWVIYPSMNKYILSQTSQNTEKFKTDKDYFSAESGSGLAQQSASLNLC